MLPDSALYFIVVLLYAATGSENFSATNHFKPIRDHRYLIGPQVPYTNWLVPSPTDLVKSYQYKGPETLDHRSGANSGQHTHTCADGLSCYECSNLHDKRCGTTFDFAKGSMEANKKFLKKCEGELASCRKLQYEDDFQGKDTNGIVVTRSCWNSPGEEGYVPENECMEMFRGKSCYCKSESCNGSEQVRVSATVVLFGLLPFLWKAL